MTVTDDLVCAVLYHQLSRHLNEPKQATAYEVKVFHVLKKYTADNPQHAFVFAGAVTRMLETDEPIRPTLALYLRSIRRSTAPHLV